MSGRNASRAARTAIVHGHADIERLDGRRVEASGRYEAITRPRQGPPAADAPRDHAVIVLGDGSRIYLEALGTPAAQRPAAEREAFDGRDVRVSGTARRQMPAAGATLLAPCLEGVAVLGPAPPDASGSTSL